MDVSSEHYPIMHGIWSGTVIQIKIHWYSFPHHWPLAKTLLRLFWFVAAKLPQLVVPKIDYLWCPVSIFRNVPEYKSRLNWSDFMALSYRGTDYPLGYYNASTYQPEPEWWELQIFNFIACYRRGLQVWYRNTLCNFQPAIMCKSCQDYPDKRSHYCLKSWWLSVSWAL